LRKNPDYFQKAMEFAKQMWYNKEDIMVFFVFHIILYTDYSEV